MYILDKIKKNIAKEINGALGKNSVRASDLVSPPKPEYGDLSMPCFALAQKEGRSPVEIAEWLVGNIRVGGAIAGMKIMGPYVNFTLDKEYLARNALKQVKTMGADYGRNRRGRGRRVMVEYSNVNTHKIYHVGHLRNLCYGDAVNRILSANGYKSIPVSYINDFGIHTAKTLWAYLEHFRGRKPDENKGYFLGRVYALASEKLDEEPLAKEKVVFMMKKIESRQGKEYELWEKTRQWSIDQFSRIYSELGVKFAHTFYESEYIDRGLSMTAKLYKREFLKKSDGAVIADLSEYGLGVLPFLRSDGTALYPVADLPLAMEKLKKFKPDESIYVIDIRQTLYFRQLFKILELIGYGKGLRHLGYEFVKLPGGMIASRTGNIISYEDLREQVTNRAEAETKKRHPEWSKAKIEKTAAVIVNGALKFEMVKVSAGQIITFDINRSLRFDGFTAAYLQYTHARICSIMARADKKGKKPVRVDYAALREAKERELIMQLAGFPEAVAGAGEKYDPSEIAKYIFSLARLLNDYYHEVPVLKSEETVRIARLALISAVRTVIAGGLSLLGIEAPEEM